MKSIIMVLGLLMATTTFSQKICQEERQNSWYHIYNTTDKIKTYYCFDDVGKEFKCGKFKAKVVRADDAWRYCPVSTNRSQVFCELPGQANLLKNTVVLANNTTCQYDKYHCQDTSFSKTVFWNKHSVCSYPFQAYKGKFNVWEVAEEETTYIKNGQISLILTEKIEFCGIEARRTNYEGVIASKAHLNSSTYMNYSDFKKNFTKIPKRFCKPKSLTRAKLRRWYIYKYPKHVAVYTCLSNTSSLCIEKVTTNITNPKIQDLCIKACGYSFCQSNTKLCREIHEIYAENDVIIGLPRECKYSERVCKPLGAFWYYTDTCRNVQKVYETFEEQCGHKKCLKQNENGTKLTLQQEGKLCEETVWYTDQQGLVASEMKLRFFKSESSVFVQKEPQDLSWFRPKSVIGSVKILESGKYYLIIIPLAVCVFGIVLKIAVCLVYLCMNCKTPKKSVYI